MAGSYVANQISNLKAEKVHGWLAGQISRISRIRDRLGRPDQRISWISRSAGSAVL
jgi:hypothetical protein